MDIIRVHHITYFACVPTLALIVAIVMFPDQWRYAIPGVLAAAGVEFRMYRYVIKGTTREGMAATLVHWGKLVPLHTLLQVASVLAVTTIPSLVYLHVAPA